VHKLFVKWTSLLDQNMKIAVMAIAVVIFLQHLVLKKLSLDVNEMKLQQSSLLNGLDDIVHIQTQLRELHLRMSAYENYH